MPGPNHDVIIADGAGTSVAISSGSITVKSIPCAKALTISGGSLTLTAGASEVKGVLTVGSSSSLIISSYF